MAPGWRATHRTHGLNIDKAIKKNINGREHTFDRGEDSATWCVRNRSHGLPASRFLISHWETPTASQFLRQVKKLANYRAKPGSRSGFARPYDGLQNQVEQNQTCYLVLLDNLRPQEAGDVVETSSTCFHRSKKRRPVTFSDRPGFARSTWFWFCSTCICSTCSRSSKTR